MAEGEGEGEGEGDGRRSGALFNSTSTQTCTVLTTLTEHSEHRLGAHHPAHGGFHGLAIQLQVALLLAL